MTRLSLLAASLLVLAAGPAMPRAPLPPAARRVADVSSDVTPRPTIPRPRAPAAADPSRPLPRSGFTAAPVPDADMTAPNKSLERESASLAPSLFNTHDAYHGDGYLPKSTPQTEQERHLRPTPGINLLVPLQ